LSAVRTDRDDILPARRVAVPAPGQSRVERPEPKPPAGTAPASPRKGNLRFAGVLPPARIPPAARTTPAGRFASEPGRNLDGEAVVWFDYDAGLAIHRLRADAARPARLQRLASRLPAAQRVSAGCVVVPVAFYETRVEPLLGRRRGVVYVLPEVRSVREVFAGGSADRWDDAGE